MVCLACSKTAKQNDSADCFEVALDTIKRHYNFYKNSIRKRDLELVQIKERNEELVKALELLQKSQQSSKRFKTNVEGSWVSPNSCNHHNTSQKDDASTDISLTDDDDEAAARVSNLNVALNSEQLFETSVLSPTRNVSNSEIVISPRTKESPKRNNQRDGLRTLKDRNKLLEKSKSEWLIKERSSPSDKSWASKFIKPPSRLKATESNVGIEIKKPEKKLNLSLKKVNPSKVKQSLLNFNSVKEPSCPESAVCDEIIDASPMVIKNSRAGRSWAQRSDLNCSSTINKTNPNVEENRKNHDENTTISIENIVFDFSPSKKSDTPAISDSLTTKLSSKQLMFDKAESDTNTDCTDQSETSSVVILTPSTQDIIFVDDTCNEISDIDTMDLLADMMKPDDTQNLKNLKRYESKTIGKQQKQIDNKEKEDKVGIIKPTESIKREKSSQQIKNGLQQKETNKKKYPSPTTTARGITANNPLLNDEEEYEEEEEEEEDDSMPRPFLIKQEPEKPTTSRNMTLMERFGISCDDCEKYLHFFGDRLSHIELAKHINQCTRHKQPDDMRHNTPEDFWNPFILSFAENDPRNEILIDTRSKDKKQLGKF